MGKRKIVSKIEIKNFKLYVRDKELGLVEILEDEKRLFNNQLYKYEGLEVEATIINPNDDDSAVMGCPIYAIINEFKIK